MAKRRLHQEQIVELRGLGLTLAQISRSTARRQKSRGALVAVSVVSFGLAGAAGSYLAFGQRAPTPVAVAALAPEATPQVILSNPAPTQEAEDVAPPVAAPAVVEMVALPAAAPTPEIIPDVVSLPTPSPEQPAQPSPTEPDTVEFANTDCVAALDSEAASIFVPFAPYAVDSTGADLTPLLDLARRVTDCDGAYLVVAGHADPSGDETQNLVLSWQRAEFVVSRLTESGLDTNRLEAIGFGSRRPLSEGAAGSDDTLNRRVDFVVREALP